MDAMKALKAMKDVKAAIESTVDVAADQLKKNGSFELVVIAVIDGIGVQELKMLQQCQPQHAEEHGLSGWHPDWPLTSGDVRP